MRICLIARNRFHSDRRAGVTHRTLVRAGHEVEVVAVDSEAPHPPVSVTVPRQIGPKNRVGAALNRFLPSAVTASLLRRRIAAGAAGTGADVFVPLHEDVLAAAVDAAKRTGGVVQRTPQMGDAGDVDLISLAPAKPELAQPVHGPSTAFTPAHDQAPYEPDAGRYRGERAVLCYRKTEANPGRYLEAALERSGFDVRVETDTVDLDTVDPKTRFVLFVESPYPAIEVAGSTDVPILFWAHHGEHHLHANLRLADRYSADAVLLAHSWHLAHWFPASVHRFPFAVAPELSNHETPLKDRLFDVAMVGSKLHSDAWQYRRRRQLVEDLETHLPAERVRFVEGVSPEDMAHLYGNSKIVLNEGGVRHYPITMRVFEAVGSGAILLTDRVPGLEMLLEPGTEYSMLGDDVVNQVKSMVGDLDSTQAVADRAIATAMGHHTYDHRVDQLVEIADKTTKRELPTPPQSSELARLIDHDVEVQRIVHDTSDDLADQLPDREVWPVTEREGRLRSASMDAALITCGSVEEMTPLLDAARRYIYARADVSGLDDYLQTRHPDAVIERKGDLIRVDLMTEAYRANPAGSAT